MNKYESLILIGLLLSMYVVMNVGLHLIVGLY